MAVERDYRDASAGQPGVKLRGAREASLGDGARAETETHDKARSTLFRPPDQQFADTIQAIGCQRVPFETAQGDAERGEADLGDEVGVRVDEGGDDGLTAEVDFLQCARPLLALGEKPRYSAIAADLHGHEGLTFALEAVDAAVGESLCGAHGCRV